MFPFKRTNLLSIFNWKRTFKPNQVFWEGIWCTEYEFWELEVLIFWEYCLTILSILSPQLGSKHYNYQMDIISLGDCQK